MAKLPEVEGAAEIDAGTDVSERQADLGKQLKNAREDLAAIKGLSERLRGELCTAAGGFEATVAAKQGAVDQLLEDLRGCKPTHHRLAQAQRHQEALVRKVAADGKKAEELSEKQELLAREVREHAEKAARNAADLNAAKQEVGRLAAERAREQGAAPIGSVPFSPGTDAWQAASTLVQYVSNPAVRAALLEAGMPPEQEAVALAAAEVMSKAASATEMPTVSAEVGHRPPGTAEAVSAVVEEAEMECAVAEYEELFRAREDEQPELRVQRLKAGLRSSQLGPVSKFRKERR